MNKDKNQFKEKLELEKDYKEPIKWIVNLKLGHLSDKDKKFITEYMFMMAESIMNVSKEKFESVLNDASKGYIKIENLPNYEDIFGSIQDMIKSNEESIKYTKEQLLTLKKKKDKLKSYEEIKEVESKIWWEEHHLEDYQKEIRFLENMQGKIIRETKWNLEKCKVEKENEK